MYKKEYFTNGNYKKKNSKFVQEQLLNNVRMKLEFLYKNQGFDLNITLSVLVADACKLMKNVFHTRILYIYI